MARKSTPRRSTSKSPANVYGNFARNTTRRGNNLVKQARDKQGKFIAKATGRGAKKSR